MLKKIVVIGPESTGKSTLCVQLAAHFNTMWCPEYAREYLLKNGNEYSYEDLLSIAEGQVELEEQYITAMEDSDCRFPPSVCRLFIDTDMYVMKVWSEFAFQKCHPYILRQIVERKYDLYLLCNTDLPWVADELREYPDLVTRNRLYAMYKDILINQTVPWVEISGDYEARLKKAISAVDNLLHQQPI